MAHIRLIQGKPRPGNPEPSLCRNTLEGATTR
jgi:hypothetical protein